MLDQGNQNKSAKYEGAEEKLNKWVSDDQDQPKDVQPTWGAF